MQRIFTIAVALFIFMLSTPGTASAFSSYPKGAPHDQITEAAAKAKGFNGKAIEVLQEAVRQPDWDETSVAYRFIPGIGTVPSGLRPNANYRAEHHFDRGKGVTNKD